MVDEPERDAAIGMCIHAWSDLGTCRAIGMALGPIPWTAIVAWCEFHELDREASVTLVQVIRQLDHERAEAEAARQRLTTARGAQ